MSTLGPRVGVCLRTSHMSCLSKGASDPAMTSETKSTKRVLLHHSAPWMVCLPSSQCLGACCDKHGSKTHTERYREPVIKCNDKHSRKLSAQEQISRKEQQEREMRQPRMCERFGAEVLPSRAGLSQPFPAKQGTSQNHTSFFPNSVERTLDTLTSRYFFFFTPGEKHTQLVQH